MEFSIKTNKKDPAYYDVEFTGKPRDIALKICQAMEEADIIAETILLAVDLYNETDDE